MYNGIGLQTARGSGTNGYVQTNKFFIRPRTNPKTDNSQSLAEPAGVRKANKEILEHDRKRQIELQVLVLQEKLEEQGYTDDEIAEKVGEVRKELEMEHLKSVNSYTSTVPSTVGRFSETQTHQVAARKEKQLEIMRAALNIKSPDEPTENPAQDQKTDNEEQISDNEERDKKSQLKEKEPDDSSSSDVEEGEFVKAGDQVAEDFKPAKESKREVNDVHRKKGDRKTKHDYSSDSYSGDENAKRGVIHDTKKKRRHDTDSESDSDSKIKQSREQQGRHKRSYSDDSGSDGYNQKRGKEKTGHRKDSYSEKISDVGVKKYDKYSKRDDYEEERPKKYDRYNKREDSEEDRSKKYDRYNKREDYEEQSKKYDRYSKREDSEDDRSLSKDAKRNERKELEKSTSEIHDTRRRYDRTEDKRNLDTVDTKMNKEAAKRKRNEYDTDEDSLDGSKKDTRRVIKGKKQYKKSSSSSESESESSDTASDDSRYKKLPDRMSKHSSRDLEAKREPKVDKPKANDRYEPMHNDINSSRSFDRSRKREVEESAVSKEKESAVSKEKERERDGRSHALRIDNKEKRVVEEERSKTERGSRKRGDSEERYDDKKRGRYDDHRYKEDSGRHRRR